MVYGFDHAEKIGCVVDPIKSVYAHFIEVFHEDVHAVFFCALQQRHEKFSVARKGLFGRKSAYVSRMYDEIRNAPRTARIHTAQGLAKQLASVRERLSHRRVRLD